MEKRIDRVFFNGGAPFSMNMTEINIMERMVYAVAIKFLQTEKPDHVVYSVREYDEKGNLKTVRFYSNFGLTDDEFYNRTKGYPGIIKAVHKRRSA
jgi:hypothetical protein